MFYVKSFTLKRQTEKQKQNHSRVFRSDGENRREARSQGHLGHPLGATLPQKTPHQGNRTKEAVTSSELCAKYFLSSKNNFQLPPPPNDPVSFCCLTTSRNIPV